MTDFSKAIEKLNEYKGSEKKKTLIYNNKKYLVKFPNPIKDKNKNIFYINNAISEYIGSYIFKIVGFNTQNTLIGSYTYNGVKKIVCACEDFIEDNYSLYEFENIALSINPNKKIETELSDILDTIDKIKNLVKICNDNIKEKFWDMFIIDALIGNTDRHNGNWGLLVNEHNEAKLAPIYDCGSCLNPILEDSEIKKINEIELKNLAINCYSCFKENNKKINFFTYIKNRNNKDCTDALKRMFKKIDIDKINKLIDDITCISKVRKNFYKKIIYYRYEIIKDVYNEL